MGHGRSVDTENLADIANVPSAPPLQTGVNSGFTVLPPLSLPAPEWQADVTGDRRRDTPSQSANTSVTLGRGVGPPLHCTPLCPRAHESQRLDWHASGAGRHD